MVGRAPKSQFPLIDRSRLVKDALRHQREDVLKISRSELSRRSGVSASSIQAIEDGRTVDPGLFTVARLAVAMHLDLSAVMRTLEGPLRIAPLHRTDRSHDLLP
ncbi:helix-turn-helix domain-containing protein [Microbacterium sp. NPDC089698]|uniref:helix-turn-helix domain-containing protein n=1 Tax=Microbacterium sp. NPDC089698 TaxID=3364200 RepID=UPI0037F92814